MDFEEWEQVKENIQPLKGGRKLDQFAKALNPKNKEQLDKERQEFEIELRTYKGDDPLDIWLRYINWTEQNFMSGGKNSKLFTLIEKCLAEFHASTEYCNDPRYVEIWLQYAELNSNPYEIFVAMDRKHIGSTHAKFYIQWAWYLEKEEKFKKALALYQEALERRAQPIGDIMEAKKKFELRVAKMSCQRVGDEEVVDFLPQAQRRTLGELPVRSRTLRTASSRIPLEDQGNRIQVPRPPRPSQQQAQITVLEDNKRVLPFLRPNTADPQMLQPRAERHVENTTIPGKWTKDAAPKLQLHKTAAKKIPFEIHQDSTAACSPLNAEPCHSRDWNVLKSIKQLEKVPLAILEPFNPKIKAMYPQHLMYIGTEEFSFEELKAMKYLPKLKEAAKQLAEAPASNGTVEDTRPQEVLEDLHTPTASVDACDPGLEGAEEFVVFEDPDLEEDKENRPPPGTEMPASKRTCSGILVSSDDIPTEPLILEEEEEEENMEKSRLEEEDCLATPLEGVANPISSDFLATPSLLRLQIN